MASKAREGCQPVRQTSSLPGLPTDASVGHVSRGEQKAHNTSQQSPGTTSACEGLIEQGICVKAERDFSRTPRGNDNRPVLYLEAQIGNILGSGTEGFGSLITRAKPTIVGTGVLRVAGWLVGCLFFSVDVIDGAQQCSVLLAISGDTDGIIHRHSCCAEFECWFFSNTVNQMLC